MQFKEKQHQQLHNINRNNVMNSKLCQHRIESTHWFDLENSIILHKCDKQFQRLILEFLYINVHQNAINARTEIENISSFINYLKYFSLTFKTSNC